MENTIDSVAKPKSSTSGSMIRINGTEIYFEDTGGSGQPIIFSHGLLLDTRLFDRQVEHLKGKFRCISYDHRGQGRSAESDLHEIDMDLLCHDVRELIHTLKLGPVHFFGLSMGGFVGMRLAARHPELVRSLMLSSTSADPERPDNKPKYKMLNFLAKYIGPKYVVNSVAPILYGKTVLQDPARAHEVKEWLQQLGKIRRSIWRAANGIINRTDVLGELAAIAAPTLVLVGDEDLATGHRQASRIVERIKGAGLVTIPRAGHSVCIEQPDAVNAAILNFLRTVR